MTEEESWETEEHIETDLKSFSKILNIPYEILRKNYDDLIIIK